MNRRGTLITYGTFDMFHIGHVNLLRRMSDIADHVVVGVSTDEFNAEKGKKTIIPYEDRIEILRACRYVDGAFAETCWEQKPDDIRREGADVFAMGDDWAGKFDDLRAFCDVLYLPRTPGVSTTMLKRIREDGDNLPGDL
ncbi:adenylyltransferase/cytidyltransferase family protein [Maritimibacter dapengensis]|uniref:Adenylyltransferase/cytidyltransferase family protein n=1 Tax=Maritimibacter dapengensis TaxID=2836868 RepID=A0ABS6T1M3_9RHOB|nr:adenylyltransferase/cytidyltransferase family protein [Maritimibacter dapengensis]MBV7379134.1 adenylyltransferase/cytidyltransferase family protein [Maritimibacter dapengensis]